MESTIIAFQLIEFIGRADGRKKLAIRKTNVLKRNIIECILKNEFDNFLQGLNELKENSVEYRSLAETFIIFYNLKCEIVEIDYEFREATMRKIKKIIEEIQKNGEKEASNLIYGRIIYIYTLHLLQIERALLTNERIMIIV